MRLILHNSSVVLLAAITLALAVCSGSGDNGSGQAMGTSRVACRAAPEKCA